MTLSSGQWRNSILVIVAKRKQSSGSRCFDHARTSYRQGPCSCRAQLSVITLLLGAPLAPSGQAKVHTRQRSRGTDHNTVSGGAPYMDGYSLHTYFIPALMTLALKKRGI